MSASSAPAQHNKTRIPFYRDTRVLAVLIQAVFAVFVVVFFVWLFGNMFGNLDTLGITDFQQPFFRVEQVNGKTSLSPWFRFLYSSAGFDILDTPISYTRQDPYLRALAVGIVNTIRVGVIGIILSTLLGVLTGVARLSSNWLLSKIALAYIEVIRNTPLLVQLFFWYFAGLLALPRLRTGEEITAVILPGPIYMTNRGIAMPWIRGTPTTGQWALFVVAAIALAWLVSFILKRQEEKRQRSLRRSTWTFLTFFAVAAIGWFVLPVQPLRIEQPVVADTGFGFVGGLTILPQLTALVFGLVIYTGAFIAEIVRAGIQAVPKGQTEAARALGLRNAQMLRLIILPQALRIIIPPMTSQYLNLVKNSSLATAVAYPELFQISGTILNQTGRAVQVIIIVMLSYLAFSLIISAFLNWYNKRVQLVER
ncbi:MAG: ABC transporter permease subunit [Caldilineae bacterium]|nr:ABC transporter permease subunit [Anaerolineae bacterium]MCB0206128.1 ABC transporter permease subunit [Anaerolineae bacterium]MCB9154339.1 ABC transporter permease subunit [Caldilineae bacterium]